MRDKLWTSIMESTGHILVRACISSSARGLHGWFWRIMRACDLSPQEEGSPLPVRSKSVENASSLFFSLYEALTLPSQLWETSSMLFFLLSPVFCIFWRVEVLKIQRIVDNWVRCPDPEELRLANLLFPKEFYTGTLLESFNWPLSSRGLISYLESLCCGSSATFQKRSIESMELACLQMLICTKYAGW